ncbi:hypothetical protein M5E87_01980 [Flavonifractor plautii]|nr:hypothetical protein M5E87_01980 [Flavonifractor plautii]
MEKATAAREELLRETRGELCELSLAIAEKVIHVSLNSSSEVVARMIQVATEKLKRREWVHIYVGGCAAKEVSAITPELMTALVTCPTTSKSFRCPTMRRAPASLRCPMRSLMPAPPHSSKISAT